MPYLCAFGCKNTDSGVVMHMFPNPKKFPEHFHAWVNLLGGKFERLSDHEIYRKKRICDIHFTDAHRNRYKRLNALAMPTLYLPGNIVKITEVANSGSEPAIPAVIPPLHDTNTGEPNHIPSTAAVLTEHNYSAISSTSRTSGNSSSVPSNPPRQPQTAKATSSRGNLSRLVITRLRVNSGTCEGETSEGGRQPTKPNKRDRLDDAISPKVSSKRPRTDCTKREGEASYAQAVNPHLSVAITTNPRIDLTEIEATTIKDQLQKAIFAVVRAQLITPTDPPFSPEFRGRAFLQDGVVKLRVAEEETLAWLKGVVPTMQAPREGYSLTLIEQRQSRPKIKAALFVPDYQEDADFLHKLLIFQNRRYFDVSSWQLTHYDITKGDRPGMLLYLGIPSEEIPKILAEDRRVAYSHGSIYIRFFTPEGLSDVPPMEETQAVPAHRPTDTRTDTKTTPTHGRTDVQTDRQTSTRTEQPIPPDTDKQDGAKLSPQDYTLPPTLTDVTDGPAVVTENIPMEEVTALPVSWEALAEADF